MILLSVIPANAGTHGQDVAEVVRTAGRASPWAPALAGMTEFETAR